MAQIGTSRSNGEREWHAARHSASQVQICSGQSRRFWHVRDMSVFFAVRHMASAGLIFTG
jgi:hypothetical protein